MSRITLNEDGTLSGSIPFDEMLPPYFVWAEDATITFPDGTIIHVHGMAIDYERNVPVGMSCATTNEDAENEDTDGCTGSADSIR